MGLLPIPPDTPCGEDLLSVIGKRSSNSLHLEHGSKTRKEDLFLSIVISEPLQEIYSQVQTMTQADWNELSRETTIPGRDVSEQKEYVNNVILLSMWLRDASHNIIRRWNSPAYLQSALGIYVDFCVSKRVFNITLDSMQDLFVRTFLRMIAITVEDNKPIDNLLQALPSCGNDPKTTLTWLENNFTLVPNPETVVLSGLCDFGLAFHSPFSNDLVPSNDHPSLIDSWISHLQLTLFPHDESYETLHKLLIVLMLAREEVDLSSVNHPGLSGIRALSDTILNDMFFQDESPLLSTLNPPLSQSLKEQWKFFGPLC